jgi:hypothetical protein
MFVTIMRAARISDLRRGHLRAEFVSKLRVRSFHRSDSEGCTIVTIERHSSDRLSADALEYLPVIAVLSYEVFRNKLYPLRGLENVAYAPKAA